MLAVATRLIVSLPPSLPSPPPIQTATLSSDNLLRYITNRLNANKYSRDINLFHLTLFRLLVLADAQMSRWVKKVEYSKGIPSGYSSFFPRPSRLFVHLHIFKVSAYNRLFVNWIMVETSLWSVWQVQLIERGSLDTTCLVTALSWGTLVNSLSLVLLLTAWNTDVKLRNKVQRWKSGRPRRQNQQLSVKRHELFKRRGVNSGGWYIVHRSSCTLFGLDLNSLVTPRS